MRNMPVLEKTSQGDVFANDIKFQTYGTRIDDAADKSRRTGDLAVYGKCCIYGATCRLWVTSNAKYRLLLCCSRDFKHIVHDKLHGNICILSNFLTLHSQVVDQIQYCKLVIVYSDLFPIVPHGLDSNQRDHVVSLPLLSIIPYG